MIPSITLFALMLEGASLVVSAALSLTESVTPGGPQRSLYRYLKFLFVRNEYSRMAFYRGDVFCRCLV